VNNDDLDFGQTIRGFAEGQKVFGRYTLRHILGRGGMGIVWLAWDEKLEEDIALKFMPEMVRLDDAGLRELKRETRKSLKLTHPNIVRIRDFVEDQRTAGIVMEYVDGATLSAMRFDQPGEVFAPEQLAGAVAQLLGAMTYAHEVEGVVHRDLKPANLMVNSRSQLKVADFGISGSITDSVSRMSMRTGTSGSPPYMSPQQVMGESPQATDDIYSVGATIYELVTGKPPFHRGNIYAQIKETVPPSMAERRKELGVTGAAEIPPVWETVVARCLAKDPADRPQSAQQMLDWLEGRETVPVDGTPPRATPSAPTQTDGAAKAGRRALPIGLAAVLLLFGGGARWWFGYEKPRVEEERQANPFAWATKETPFENTLGMKFVPVPIYKGGGSKQVTGTILMSQWETRVKDYQAFCDATGRDWVKPRFEQTSDHPAVGVSWEDAQTFCDWLSKKEGRTYRLSTDHEWSCAVGIGEREDARATPESKDGKIADVFPWGSQWPPPNTAGNYAGEEMHAAAGLAAIKAATGLDGTEWIVIAGFNDGFVFTSPVGIYRPNIIGIYDLGGNVWEWCEDKYGGSNASSAWRVLRGGSWYYGYRGNVLSSYRNNYAPEGRIGSYGFRVVCAAGSGG